MSTENDDPDKMTIRPETPQTDELRQLLGPHRSTPADAALTAFLTDLWALGHSPAPAPSADLDALLTAGAPVVRKPVGQARRTALRRWGAGLVVVGITGVGAVGAAAAADQLPRPVQRLLADLSERYLPFSFPSPAPDPAAPALPRSVVSEQTGDDYGRGSRDGAGTSVNGFPGNGDTDGPENTSGRAGIGERDGPDAADTASSADRGGGTSSGRSTDDDAATDVGVTRDDTATDDTGTVDDATTTDDTGTVDDATTTDDTGTVDDATTTDDTGTVDDATTADDTTTDDGGTGDSDTKVDDVTTVDDVTGVDGDTRE